ncbi:MAG: hypothetical protein F9K31_12000 [Dokdonella sp.]|nr:MAG: hypothetical protein F9K31_12000 [Dokdonella sp.]
MSAGGFDPEARRPVWEALSELYLDVPWRPFVRGAARTLAGSPYSLGELRAILFDEVHPVLVLNLCATAGVWDRFDQAWLEQRILTNRARWWRPWPCCGRRYARLLWRVLAPRIERERAAAMRDAWPLAPEQDA